MSTNEPDSNIQDTDHWMSEVQKEIVKQLREAHLLGRCQHRSGDDGFLISFQRPMRSGALEIYPDGEIIFIMKRGEKRDLYEYGPEEIKSAIHLLRFYGFHA